MSPTTPQDEVPPQNGTGAPDAAPGETGPGPAAGEAERQSTPFLVLQFFVFPMAIVAVCVAVFVVFGLLASEGKSARDYLTEVRTGSANRRWQAAFELAKALQAGKDPALRDPAFVAEVVELFAESERDDPRVRRYLALALGRLRAPEAVAALAAALGPEAGAADAETQIYAASALGAIGDPRAVPALVGLAATEDAGVRKAAVHALGRFGGEPAARAALAAALGDRVEDVRWNAALALARQGDAAANPVVVQMLDRGQLARVPGITPEQQEAVLLQAIASAPALGDPAVRQALEALREVDPSPKVRDAARAALEAPAGAARP